MFTLKITGRYIITLSRKLIYKNKEIYQSFKDTLNYTKDGVCVYNADTFRRQSDPFPIFALL